MGENVCYAAVRKAIEDLPALILNGYRLSKYLSKSLIKLGINITEEQNDAENDLAAAFAQNKKLVVNFGQVKTLFRYHNQHFQLCKQTNGCLFAHSLTHSKQKKPASPYYAQLVQGSNRDKKQQLAQMPIRTHTLPRIHAHAHACVCPYLTFLITSILDIIFHILFLN